MNEPIDIEIVRAEALRKLGRNMVNFSKIEAVLKYLLSMGQFEGTEETISEQLRRNQARLHKQSLGKLVQEFHKNVVVDASQVETTTASSNSGISFYFKVTCDNPDFLKIQKRALSDVVVERNKLIHQDLALLDTSCVEDYRKLISLMDEQNPRLLAHLEELGWIIKSVSNGWQTFGDLFKSPEFLEYIQSSQADA
ncbi:hypothetical protein [Leptolyngbya sp. FACHB-711]|uniref:hypothetical protein n=1 Tax=unclassified Leptolyngbya TaxID=2650499 RepID=UPI001685B22F|nr:hypothetical protein [Leptolyngbya sp. FACHB-711]MBD2024243.1 hypothetical protein [Leptolyngbya sp. FACHB-711]